MAQDTIQSLWIGNCLSTMERLCIQSFLDHGHAFHLYAYEKIENVPPGATVRDGREILPAEEIFVYQRGGGKGSPSAFSNWFRYKLLLQQGGWWVDLDVVCLQPLHFPQEHLLGYEHTKKGGVHVGSAIIKAPPQSPLMEFCWREAQKINKEKVRWGEIGPALVNRAVEALKMQACVLPPETFYPVSWWETSRLVTDLEIPSESYCLHLWHEKWKQEGLNPVLKYTPDCIYEKIKQRHAIVAQESDLRIDQPAPPKPSLFRRFMKSLTPT